FPLPVFLMLAAVFAAVSIVKADVLGAGTADAKGGTAAEPKQAAPAKEFPHCSWSCRLTERTVS
ncbi:hypothetical protein EN811_29020, partial [bacterium M00.F.Ca.ET.168.01.1.1]